VGPQSEKNTNEGAYLSQRGSMFPSYQAQMGFGYAGNMYGGALGTGFGAVGGYAQVSCMSNAFLIVLSN
jgi:hypothetical protein